MKRKIDAEDTELPNGHTAKRQIKESGVEQHFRPNLFDKTTLEQYKQEYSTSRPYKHGVLQNLISPSLLRSVRDEIRTNISFTPKETDIYKIHQSGDLTNLDGLDDFSLRLLPSLVTLRDALYSAPFRHYLTTVTGSGPLSGKKTDMAVNVYTPGCHLLCHDDVIGSRRVSYILYLTNPEKPWRKEWGGALRLYSTEKFEGKDGRITRVPSVEWERSIPPAWNQLSFFAVQPGESFHDVEEVYPKENGDTEDDNERVRMAISGWYHIPQTGEEGYEEGAEEKQAEKSSLTQLQGKAESYDLPQPQWTSLEGVMNGTAVADLTENDLNFLIKFMNPRYLTPDTVIELSQSFSDESSLRLGCFLSEEYAAALYLSISVCDQKSASTTTWNVARPPHKHRFLYRKPTTSTCNGSSALPEDNTLLLLELLNDFFPSLAFKKWLSLATDLSLNECNILARRFRRGLDYTLATSYEESEPRLEICLGITPTDGWSDDVDIEKDTLENGGPGKTITASNTNGTPTIAQTEESPALEGAVGGYEVYMAGDDNDAPEGSDIASSNHGVLNPSSHTGAGNRPEKADPAVYKSAGDDQADDGVLFSMPACWNTLSIVLRDKGVLKFVKYVTKSARGDRWDVVGEWKVEPETDEEDGEEAKGIGPVDEVEDEVNEESEKSTALNSEEASGEASEQDSGEDSEER